MASKADTIVQRLLFELVPSQQSCGVATSWLEETILDPIHARTFTNHSRRVKRSVETPIKQPPDGREALHARPGQGEEGLGAGPSRQARPGHDGARQPLSGRESFGRPRAWNLGRRESFPERSSRRSRPRSGRSWETGCGTTRTGTRRSSSSGSGGRVPPM